MYSVLSAGFFLNIAYSIGKPVSSSLYKDSQSDNYRTDQKGNSDPEHYPLNLLSFDVFLYLSNSVLRREAQ